MCWDTGQGMAGYLAAVRPGAADIRWRRRQQRLVTGGQGFGRLRP